MQIERLVQMVFCIVSREHVTAKELAGYFNVSTRTIYRDVNTLSLAGIPIISTKGTGGGISLISGYTIDKSLLSKEEQQNIFQGLQILEATKYPNAQSALSKIGAVFRNALEPKWLEVDFTYWGSGESESVKLSDLQYAILNKHVITFKYLNSEFKQSERAVEPLRLVFKSHAWYIMGFCLYKQDMRFFRMSRMKDIKVMEEIFKRELPQDYSILGEYKGECDLPLVKLKFAPEIAHRVYDEFHEGQIEKCADGSYLVAMQLELNNWAFNYLLSFGKYLEVIEPKTLRAMLKEKALDIVKIYE